MIIYKITNLLNGRIYVGQDSHNDPKYFGSGKLIRRSIKKHGIENFAKDILEEGIETKEELDAREIYWIDELNALTEFGNYNIKPGGSGGDVFTNNPNKEEIRVKYKKIEIFRRIY